MVDCFVDFLLHTYSCYSKSVLFAFFQAANIFLRDNFFWEVLCKITFMHEKRGIIFSGTRSTNSGQWRINDDIPLWSCAEPVSLSTAAGQSCSSLEVGEGHLQPIISPALSSLPSLPSTPTVTADIVASIPLYVICQHHMGIVRHENTHFISNTFNTHVKPNHSGDQKLTVLVLWPVHVTAL